MAQLIQLKGPSTKEYAMQILYNLKSICASEIQPNHRKTYERKITKQHSMKEALIPNVRQNLDYATKTKQA